MASITTGSSLISDNELITDAVLDKIADISDIATNAYNIASSSLHNLATQTFDLEFTSPEFIDPAGVTVNPVRPSAITVDSVSFGDTTFEGTAPDTTDLYTPITFEAPTYTGSEYNFTNPVAPTITWPTFNKEAPAVSDITLPTNPVNINELPDVPSITTVSIPDTPVYNELEFTTVAPVADLDFANISFSWEESLYQSGLKTKLCDELYNNLVAGGTGLDEATEQAIYTRATSRLEVEENEMLEAISDRVAKRGFDLPPGQEDIVTTAAEVKILRSREDLNNDILIQQSKLAQENTHFIIEKVIQVEGILINYHTQVQERSFNSAKYLLESAYAGYRFRLESYKERCAAYAILANVFQVRIQAEIAKAEFFKTQMEGSKLHVEVQELYIRAYLGQLEGIRILLDTYKTQMEGVQIASNIDKTKIEAYAIEVNALNAKTQLALGRIDGYKAELSGEQIKANIKELDVKAYLGEAQAYGIKSSAETAKAETSLTALRAKTAIYEMALKKYQVDIGKIVSEAEVAAKEAGLKVAVFDADSKLYSNEIGAQIDIFRGHVEESKAKANVATASADLAVRAALGQYELAVECAKGVTSVSGQLAASALGAVNASLHASSSDTRTDYRGMSSSESRTTSTTNSDSFMEEHIYSYSN